MSEQIQHLLSLAAEEQAAESRAVSTVLAQIRDRVAELADQISGLSGLSEAVAAVDADLRQSTTMLADRLNAVGGSGPDTDALAALVTEKVTAAVAEQVAESEARMTAYLDTAVLALAKALLLGGRGAVLPQETAAAPAVPLQKEGLKPAGRTAAPEPVAEVPAAEEPAPAEAATKDEPPAAEDTSTLRPADTRRGRWRSTGA